MIAQISQRYRPEGMSEQAGAQEDILGLKKKKTFKDKIINTWWGRKKKLKKKKIEDRGYISDERDPLNNQCITIRLRLF